MFARRARRKDSAPSSRGSMQMPAMASVLLLSAGIALTPLAVTAQQPPANANVHLSGHINYARTSPPASGVKLLEDIFSRVRSAPQIAMARNLMKQQQTLEPPAEKQGPTDYKLAIRPKALTGKTTNSPSLQIIASSKTNQAVPLAAMNATDSLTAAFTGADDGMVSNRSVRVSNASQAARPEPVAEVLLGARQYPIIAQGEGAAAGFGAGGGGQTRSRGMWEMPQQSAAENELKRASDKDKYQPPDLATATGRLFGITNALQNAQNYRDQLDKQRQIAVNTEARRRSQSRAQRADEIAYKGDSFGAASAEADGAVLTDMRSKDKESSIPPVNMGKNVYPAAPAAAPAPPPAVSKAKAAMREAKEESAANMPARLAAANKKAVIAMGDIALLPPNVVTGIPLVRLGSSETQASGALQAIGSMKQLKVNKWTVWSWSRPQTKNGTSLQLYMRNGLLDAMRIFDPGLIGPDFGVNLGDSLARVKEKFGEPAFILQEPGPGAGQNYVYPISQVGFQLARPAPGEQPRVVSVLIFNVK